MEKGQTCGTCKFFKALNERGGQCRFNPPQVLAIPQPKEVMNPRTLKLESQQAVTVQGHYPMQTKNDEGCGQYQRGEWNEDR